MASAPESSTSSRAPASTAALAFLDRLIDAAALGKKLSRGKANDPLFTFLSDGENETLLMRLCNELLPAEQRRAAADPDLSNWPYWKDPILDLDIPEDDPDPGIEEQPNPWHGATGSWFMRGRRDLLTIVAAMRSRILAGAAVTFSLTTNATPPPLPAVVAPAKPPTIDAVPSPSPLHQPHEVRAAEVRHLDGRRVKSSELEKWRNQGRRCGPNGEHENLRSLRRLPNNEHVYDEEQMRRFLRHASQQRAARAKPKSKSG